MKSPYRAACATNATTDGFKLAGTTGEATKIAVHARLPGASDFAGQGSVQAGACISPSIQRTMLGNASSGKLCRPEADAGGR